MSKISASERRKNAALKIMSIEEIEHALNVECITYDMLLARLNKDEPIFNYMADLYTFLHDINVSRTPEAKKKCRQLYYNLDAWRANTKKTLQEKYGQDITNISQVKEIQDQKRRTFESNYGPGLLMGNAKFKEMAERRNMELYGYKNPFESVAVQNQILRDAEVKYGLPSNSIVNISQIPEIREKVNQTNLTRCGNICQLNSPDKIYQRFCQAVDSWNPKSEFILTLKDRELTIQEIKKVKKPSGPKLAEYFGISLTAMYTILAKYELWEMLDHSASLGTASQLELEFKEWLEDLTHLTFEKRTDILGGLELDLYNDEYKLAIEFNGAYWHSNCHVDKHYHERKSKMCEERGIRLIHLYDYEWLDLSMRDKLISFFNIACHNVKKRIYARNCDIRQISNAEAKAFNEANHLQGHRNAKITYGLFYENKLVQLMSFSKNKKYEWEIIRGCPGSNNIVVGGVEKLFTHFIRECRPTEIFSYCDFNKFDGRSYSAIGMQFIGYTGPDKTWIVHGTPVKRNASKYQELKKISDYIIWGSGSKKYLWTSTNV